MAQSLVTSLLKELKSLGNPNTAAIYRRHGVLEETYGVPYAALGRLVARIKTDSPDGLRIVGHRRARCPRLGDQARGFRTDDAKASQELAQ